MNNYYLDSRAAPGGDGSYGSPWDLFASITGIADGAALNLACQSTFHETLSLPYSGLTITAYGDGDLPVISGASTVTNWAAAIDSVWSYSLGSNIGGNVSEDGQPMIFRAFSSSIANTGLQRGEYTFDASAFIVYISPSSGTPSQHEYKVSDTLYGWNSYSAESGAKMSHIRFEHHSRHAILLGNRSNIEIEDCQFRLIGGYKSGSLYVGNGIELTAGCHGARACRNTFEYIFDSACTSQLYEGSAASLSRHVWEDNTINHAGLSGVEISAQTANQTMTSIVARRNDINNLGNVGWLRNRAMSPYGIGAVNNGGASVVIAGVTAEHNVIRSTLLGIINISGAGSAAAGFESRFNELRGPGTFNATLQQGIRARNGSVTSYNDLLVGWNYAAFLGETSAQTVKIVNGTFADNNIGTFQDNPNGSFETTNCLFLRNAQVHGGNQTGTYTGNRNCLWQNTAEGANYSSSADLEEPPQVDDDFVPRADSPLLGAGLHTGYRLGADKRMFGNPPSIGAFEAA